jgi:hypothetical protein
MPKVTMDSFDVRVGRDVQSSDEVLAVIATSGGRHQRRVLGEDETGAPRVRISGANIART